MVDVFYGNVNTNITSNVLNRIFKIVTFFLSRVSKTVDLLIDW